MLSRQSHSYPLDRTLDIEITGKTEDRRPISGEKMSHLFNHVILKSRKKRGAAFHFGKKIVLSTVIL